MKFISAALFFCGGITFALSDECTGSNTVMDMLRRTNCEEEMDHFVKVEMNGCPSYPPENVPTPKQWERNFFIPKHPLLRDTKYGYNTMASENGRDPIGFLFNGVYIFGPDSLSLKKLEEQGGVDSCGGYTGFKKHHHHDFNQLPSCILGNEADHSPMIGFLIDGFPVYGPNSAGGAPPTDLDACGGHTHANNEGGLGYHYHLTGSEAGEGSFGHCFRGCLPDINPDGENLEMESFQMCRREGSPPEPGVYVTDISQSSDPHHIYTIADEDCGKTF